MKGKMELYEALSELEIGEVEMELSDREVACYMPKLLERCGIPQDGESRETGAAKGLPTGNRKGRIRPVYLLAAVIAAMSLMGAGYAAYLNRLARPAEVPKDFDRSYDRYVDDSDTLVEPPAFELGEPAGNSGSVVELELLGYRHLETVFEGRAPGEVLDVEIHGPDQKLKSHGLTGNAYNALFSVTDRGSPSRDLLLNRANAPSTQKVLDELIAAGRFIVTIDSPEYTPTTLLSLNDDLSELHYTDSKGAGVNIFFSRALEKIPLFPEDYEIAEELTINGNPFILIDKGEYCQAYLYLGEYKDVYYTDLSIGYQNGSREQVLDVMRHITVHNEKDNSKAYDRKAYLEEHPYEQIRANASEIAQALQTDVVDETGAHAAVPVWEKGNVLISKWERVDFFTIEVEESFAKDSPLYPYSLHTMLPDQPWFPKDQLSKMAVYYDGRKQQGVTCSSQDNRYHFSSRMVDGGYARTALDAVIVEMAKTAYGYGEIQILEPIEPISDNPIVVALLEDTAAIYSAVRIRDNQFLVQMLSVPLGELPGELGNR